MKRIHAVMNNGEVISGVRVFREAYERVGLGWIYSVTRIPLIGKYAEIIYNFWAKYRTDLTRGASLDEIVTRRNQLIEKKLGNSKNCSSGECNI